MKKILFLMTVVALAASISSCNMNYEKTKSGLRYKIIKGPGKEKLKVGDLIKFHISFDTKIASKDTVLVTSFDKMPNVFKIDTGARYSFSFVEILPLCFVGDSLVISMSIDSMKSKNMIRDYDRVLVKGGQIRVKVKILKKYANETEIQPDMEKEMKALSENETALLEKYLKEKNIKAEKTEKGAFVEIITPGDASMKADSGKTAQVMYKGYLQADHSKVFDSNMDSSFHHTDPLSVTVGMHQVLPVWEEALQYFGKGGKGRIYVPSMLGYPDGTGDGRIPAKSNLIFDIEVKDVTTAPPPPPVAMPAPPHQAH